MTDPFEQMAEPYERQTPRPSFVRSLRASLVEALGLDPLTDTPTIELPGRSAMPSTSTTPATRADLTTTPYLCVHDGAAAIDWYVAAFGGVEQMRVVGDDGRLGHAEITVDGARFMLSDEYVERGVVSPRTLGGTATAIHLSVVDVDATFARAVAAGATTLAEPEDQPHGARHGTILDPFGHRWMLSQTIEQVSIDDYAARSDGSGFRVLAGPRAGQQYTDGIWAVMAYTDPDVGIRFVTEVLGFEELVLVRDADGAIVHSEYRWPEGGIVQLAGADANNPFVPEPGHNGGLYVITQDPQAVWERCQATGVEVIRPPEEPHYDPGGMGFSIRDPEGNPWSFGSYVGGATE
ncbi:MAG: VOC family protein [Acidimicrobiia bacterium]|nr:VOC family protein [Acidimicrobiia bacterium]